MMLVAVFIIAAFSVQQAFSARSINGFDLSSSVLPVEQILHGGPPRDGIPAISNPNFIDAAEADYLRPEDRVIGIEIAGEKRAYPIPILNWHEIVNDEIDGQPFAITYCPLCGTGVAFEATIDGRVTEFGVSGLLYNSDVLLYDRNTESLWSQVLAEAISGPQAGKRLTLIPIAHTTWKDWSVTHPDTLVMSTDTGYARDYRRDPYAGYERSRHTYFEVNNEAPDNYHPKEVVLGLQVDGEYKAYPFIELDKLGKSRFSDTLNGTRFDFEWDSENRSIEVRNADGEAVAGIQGFWFAWFAFHPDTAIFKGDSI